MDTRKSLLLLIPLLCLPSCGQSEEITFHSNVEDHTFPTRYDDRLFSLSNEAFHPEIAVASYATAMATIRSDCDYPSRSGFLLELWEKEGFSSFYVNDSFKERPGLDTIGYAFAHKQITFEEGTTHLFAVAIRSGTYEGEWASNITLGEDGDAKGMADSASIVYEGLRSYLQEQGFSGKAKFWLSGYSRGGSVANLLAGRLLDDLEEGTFLPAIEASREDVYAYCFEPIACALEKESSVHGPRYRGVKNLLNFNDLMPHVIPAGWGFTRYGEDLYYPDRLTDIRFCFGVRKNMLNRYRYEKGGHKYTPYTVDEWEYYDVGETAAKEHNLPRESLFPSIGRFVRQLAWKLSSTVTRFFYYGLGEPSLREFIATLMGLNPDIGGDLITPSAFLAAFTSYPFLRNLVVELQQGNAGDFTSDIGFFLYELFGANRENFAAIKKLCDNSFFLFYMIAATFIQREDLALQFFSRDNLLKLFQGHYTELNYSFTRSLDPRIYGAEACSVNDGSYYLLHVAKAAEIHLEEERYGEVFSFDGTAMKSPALAAERFQDGSIDIFLPKNGVYSYRCIAEDVALSDVDSSGAVRLLQEGMPLQGRISR